jgi:AcrR family transcriptional regulator
MPKKPAIPVPPAAEAPETGRHSARDPERRSARDRVFETASDLFYRKGIRAVGVEAIAAEANTTKMSLYRNFPSKDELVAAWLRDHDTKFWLRWDAMTQKHPDEPGKQLLAAFTLLSKHVADPEARGCPMANTAVEITEADHPARKVIEDHKAELRRRLAALCAGLGAPDARSLADQLFLLMEGAHVSSQLPGARVPASNLLRAASALIDAGMGRR